MATNPSDPHSIMKDFSNEFENNFNTDFDDDFVPAHPPRPERQITQGGAKTVFTKKIAMNSGKWVVQQQCGGLPVTKFLQARWAGKSLEEIQMPSWGPSDDEMTRPFWLFLVAPNGHQVTLYEPLSNLVAALKAREIHSEDDIFLITEHRFRQDYVPSEHDIAYEKEIEKVFLKPADDKKKNVKV